MNDLCILGKNIISFAANKLLSKLTTITYEYKNSCNQDSLKLISSKYTNLCYSGQARLKKRLLKQLTISILILFYNNILLNKYDNVKMPIKSYDDVIPV